MVRKFQGSFAEVALGGGGTLDSHETFKAMEFTDDVFCRCNMLSPFKIPYAAHVPLYICINIWINKYIWMVWVSR